MPKNKNIQRVPRPKGFTMALSSIHNLSPNNPQKTKEHKQKLNYLKRLMLEQWTLNNYELYGRRYSVSQIAEYLGWNNVLVMRAMQEIWIRASNAFGGKNGERLEQLSRAEILKAHFGASETLSLAAQQVHTLVARQRGKFVPFLTGEVNKSIANLINAQKLPIELIKIMLPTQNGALGGTKKGMPEDTNGAAYLTTSSAAQLLTDSDQKTALEDVSQVALLLPESSSLPDISAKTQDLSKIGIRPSSDMEEAFKKERKNAQNKASFEHGNRGQMEVLDEEDFLG